MSDLVDDDLQPKPHVAAVSPVTDPYFRAVWDSSSDAMALSDADGIVLAVNAAYIELYGFPESEVVGQSFAVIFPEEQRGWAEEQYRAVFASADPPGVAEARVQRKDGTVRYVDSRASFITVDGRREAMLSAIRDMTETRGAYRALEDSEQRLRLALEATGIGVYHWNPITDKTNGDERLRAIIGLRPGDEFSLAAAVNEHIHPEDRDRYIAAVAEMLDPGGPGRLDEEVRWIDARGSERWLTFTGQATFAGEGAHRRAVSAIGGVIDVTSHRQAEEQREIFVAAAAHDLRTPLTSLLGQTQLLQRQIRRGHMDPDQVHARLATIVGDVHRMITMIDEMMDATRIEAGRALELRLAFTDLVPLVQQAVEDAQATTSRHVLRVMAETSSLVGRWDGARLRRLLGNLLGNGIKYSPAGGEILVRLRREETDSGVQAVVAISDQGVGIPAVDLDLVFERFRRGTNVAGRIRGTGLGLTGALQIATQHGGTLEVESEEGAGSTFTLRLPLMARPAS